MTVHPFRQVDVFTNGPFTGNPLAVVHDADNVAASEMQTLTRWTNLSEAAFLMQPTVPGADYLVRIFEPKTELPFAGHPTLGACAAWLDAGGVPREPGVVVQECGAGLVEIKRTAEGLAFAAPPTLRHEPIDDDELQRALDTLGLDADDVVASHWIDNGPGWMGLLLTDAERVRSIAPVGRHQQFVVGVAGRYFNSAGDLSDIDLEVRAFFNDSDGSIREDPVTGSLNASLAQWLIGAGRIGPRYTARQTTGVVTVERDAADIWVGGAVDVRISGSIDL